MRGDYVTDIAYPRHFHREVMPVWMASVLAAQGRRAPDPGAPCTWLELGCGGGLDAVVAAATNPSGRFVGIDFNPRAIAAARSLALAAAVGNVAFHCLDFEQAMQAPEETVPYCDFIVVHGVYSWIAPAGRAAVRQLVQQKLKPGGVLYLSYLSHPGSASFAAPRRLVHMATRHLGGSSAARAREGLLLLERMARAGAGYFEEHPATLRDERAMDDAAAAFLAHEYLNEHWSVLHVADVIADLAVAGCEYAGSATPHENIDAASLPGGTCALLDELRQGGADVATMETFKDVARYQTQRCDLYQRRHPCGNLLSPDEHRDTLLAQRVCLLPAAPRGPLPAGRALTVQSRNGPVKLPLADMAPLLSALQEGPRSYAELAALPSYAQRPAFVSQLLQVLVWAGWLQYLRPGYRAEGRQAMADAPARRLNATLACMEPPFNGRIVAGAAIGSAIPVPAAGGDRRCLQWLAAD